MKKIRCDWAKGDYIQISPTDSSDIHIDVKQYGKRSRIRIGADKIRKLRKQLKRALMKIEGEKEEYKPGDSVYLAEGHNEGDDFCKSPSVCDINLSIPVKLIEGLGNGKWKLEYKTCSGGINTGFAYEKSFGHRA